MKALLRILTAALFAVVTLGSAFALDVPGLTGRVVDGAKVLSEQQKSELSALLKGIEDKTTAQVVVLTVESLGGEDVFEFVQKTYRQWKLGQADKNNGLLIFASKGDRKFRVHTGYGLEGPIPDAEALSIARRVMGPYMQGRKNGTDDYFGAFKAGIERVSALLNGEVQPRERLTSEGSKGGDGGLLLFGFALFVGCFFGIFHPFAGGAVGGLGFAASAAFLIGTVPSVLIAGAVGFLVCILCSVLGVIPGLGGGFGGGGVFSGGGGSSGGGGASSDF